MCVQVVLANLGNTDVDRAGDMMWSVSDSSTYSCNLQAMCRLGVVFSNIIMCLWLVLQKLGDAVEKADDMM